jgi:nondiscriminating glutamyl-tRNA synthetase
MSYAGEIVELSELFFKDELALDEEASEVVNGEQVPELVKSLTAQLEALDTFDAASIKAAIKAVQKETGIKGKNLFMPIRVMVSGQTHGPELPNTMELLGKDKVIERLSVYA